MSALGLTDEDRSLLEQYAPCLAYDPQDALRATAAATMTDNDENSLRRAENDQEIAAGVSLSLATLTNYPGTQVWKAGDYLASAGDAEDALIDAMRLQDGHPHTAYGRVLRDQGGQIWLQYWLWYYDNPKTFAGRGRHQGDWEFVQIGLSEGGGSVTYSQHTGGQTRDWGAVDREPVGSDHPLVYVAPFSHANYFEPRTYYYFPAADHPTGRGPHATPQIEPFGDWERWRGRWGRQRGPLHGLLRVLGGRSPDAPIAQTSRWCDPGGFCKRGRRRVKNTVRDVIWQVGKRTFPREPRLRRARFDDLAVEVAWELDQDLLHHSRHILLTITGSDGLEPLAGKCLVRNAGRTGSVEIDIRHQASSYRAWACTFNRLGQRSDVVGPLEVV
jgi:hypothetical protein